MLVLDAAPDGYPDDAEPEVRYRLPTGLAPLAGGGGVPQATLSRSPDGGLLNLRLGGLWPELGARERRVPIAGGRFRLLLRSPASTESGRWHTTSGSGDVVVDRGVSLDTVEAAIARRLGAGGDDLVDVEVELDLRGIMPVFPWIVRAEVGTLRARIGALLGSTPASWQAVEDAFSGLARDTFDWYPLEPGAMPPPTDEALLAIAGHAAPTLLESGADGWTVADGGPERLEVSLAVPRSRTASFGLSWSFSEFLAAQDDPSLHLVDLATPAPFEAADLHVVNDVPLAGGGVQTVLVEVRTGGPTGMVRHEFLPGAPSATRLRFVRETFEDLEITWRSRATVVIGGRPQNLATDFRSTGLMIHLTSKTLGLTPLRFAAQPGVFDHAASIEIAIGRRTLELTAEASEAWAVGRRAPTEVEVAAVLDSGERIALGPMALGAQGLTVGTERLGVGDVTPVVLEPPADLAQRSAYLAVQIEGGPWRTVDPGGEINWPVRRASRLQPPRLRYRVRQVPRAADGTTRVVSESDWREGVGEAVTLAL